MAFLFPRVDANMSVSEEGRTVSEGRLPVPGHRVEIDGGLARTHLSCGGGAFRRSHCHPDAREVVLVRERGKGTSSVQRLYQHKITESDLEYLW